MKKINLFYINLIILFLFISNYGIGFTWKIPWLLMSFFFIYIIFKSLILLKKGFFYFDILLFSVSFFIFLVNEPLQYIFGGFDFPGILYDYKDNIVPNKTGIIINLFSTLTFLSMSAIKNEVRYSQEDMQSLRSITIKPYITVLFLSFVFIPFVFFGSSGIIENIIQNTLGRAQGLSFTDTSLGTKTPILSLFSTLLPVSVFILFLNFIKSSRKVFTGALFFGAFILYAFTGGRTGIIIIFTSLSIYLLLSSNTGKIPIVKLAIFGLFIYVLISIQVSSRYVGEVNMDKGGLTGSNLNREIAYIADEFGEKNKFTNASNLLEQIILPIPQTLLLFVTNPIPRLIWKNKPYDKSFAIYNEMRTGNNGLSGTSNITPSIPGRYYLKYGYIGVVEIALLLGLLWALLCKKIINKHDPNLSIVYIIGLALFFVSIRDFTAGRFYPLLGAYLFYYLNKKK